LRYLLATVERGCFSGAGAASTMVDEDESPAHRRLAPPQPVDGCDGDDGCLHGHADRSRRSRRHPLLVLGLHRVPAHLDGAGPLLCGIIVQSLSWRWVFFINVPAGIAAAALLVVALHEHVEHRRHSLDLAGAGVLTLGLAALLFGTHGGVASAIGLPLAAVSLFAFFAIEKRAPEPVVPLDLFRERVMSVATATGALVGAGMISMVTYVPLYVQGVLGGTPTEAGSAITPMVIGWPIASAISGRLLPRVGFRILVRSGLAISAVAAIALAIF